MFCDVCTLHRNYIVAKNTQKVNTVLRVQDARARKWCNIKMQLQRSCLFFSSLRCVVLNWFFLCDISGSGCTRRNASIENAGSSSTMMLRDKYEQRARLETGGFGLFLTL